MGKPAFRGARHLYGPGWPGLFEVILYGATGVRWWKNAISPGWEDGMPETAALDEFARERWRLSMHKRTIDEEIGHFPRSYRWLLATYRTQLSAVRDFINTASLTPSSRTTLVLSSGMRAVVGH